MHRCSSSQGNMVGPCSCGLFHSQSNSYSMLFPMPNHKSFDETDMYPYTPSSSSVDCTLSLGTPSTRLCEEYDVVEDKRSSSRHDHHRSGSNSYMSNICWDMLQNKNSSNYSQQTPKSSRGSTNGISCNSSGNDSLLARRCANCDTTSTPLWRNGPRGPKVCKSYKLTNKYIEIF